MDEQTNYAQPLAAAPAPAAPLTPAACEAGDPTALLTDPTVARLAPLAGGAEEPAPWEEDWPLVVGSEAFAANVFRGINEPRASVPGLPPLPPRWAVDEAQQPETTLATETVASSTSSAT